MHTHFRKWRKSRKVLKNVVHVLTYKDNCSCFSMFMRFFLFVTQLVSWIGNADRDFMSYVYKILYAAFSIIIILKTFATFN